MFQVQHNAVLNHIQHLNKSLIQAFTVTYYYLRLHCFNIQTIAIQVNTGTFIALHVSIELFFTVESDLQSMPALPMYMCFRSTSQKEEFS